MKNLFLKKTLCFFFLISVFIVFFSCNENQKNIQDYEIRVIELEKIRNDFQSGDKYIEFTNLNPNKFTLLKDGFINKTQLINESTRLSKEQKENFYTLQNRGKNAITEIERIIELHESFAKLLDVKLSLLTERSTNMIENPTSLKTSKEYLDFSISNLQNLMKVDNNLIDFITNFNGILSNLESERYDLLFEKENEIIEKTSIK